MQFHVQEDDNEYPETREDIEKYKRELAAKLLEVGRGRERK